MLEELVNDGNEVICLRVVDKDAKVVNDRSVDKKQSVLSVLPYQSRASRGLVRAGV